MWRVMLFLSLLGFITLANAQKDSKSGVHRGGAQSHFGPGPSVRTSVPAVVRTAPPVVQTAPTINTAPQSMHRAPASMTPRATMTPPATMAPPATVTPRVPRYHTRQETVNQLRHESSQSSNWHGGHGIQERHGGRHGQGHYRHHGNYHHYNNGGTSVFVPYWWYGTYPYYNDYPYYSSSRVAYPNRIFICYEEDQVYKDRYHIGCPVPISWYSTDPAYDSEDYQTQYRPEYVCPGNGASHYVEFSNSYEANTWWNNNCNRWIFTP